MDRGRRLRLSELRQEVEMLRSAGSESMTPIWPSRDLGAGGGWVWSGFSQSQLQNRVANIYSASLKAFSELADQWFFGLRHAMPMALLMPVRLAATLGITEDPGYPGPTIDIYMEPLEGSSASTVDLVVNQPLEPRDFRGQAESVNLAVRRHRSQYVHRIRPSRVSSVLDVFGPDPVTGIVYRWLWEDLKSAGWLSGPAPHEESHRMVGAKLAGFRAVSLSESAERTVDPGARDT
jgi:hypothetical protein